jgi:uncharacterized membrane protein
MWRKKTAWYILIGLAIVIKVFSLFPDAVERYYAGGIYPVISGAQRILFGWIPFSVGDLLYAFVVIVLLVRLYRMVKLVVRRKTNRQYWKNTLALTVFVVLSVYVSFNLLWGLNYNRQGIAAQLKMNPGKYDKNDLYRLMSAIVVRLNSLDSVAKLDRMALNRKRILFDGAVDSYKKLATLYPEIHYSFRSVKPSLFSYLGNYLGYTGYYNPFTGEAQVNTTVPVFAQPFTTCHEIGHQLGYAKENEANFAGFLSARVSDNPGFRYSVYFDMYAYSRFYLYSMDSLAAKQLDGRLRPGVKKDFRELREFIKRHRNPIEAVIDKLYGQYLKANQQPSGRLSYSEVISWLVAYQKLHGWEPI